MSIWKKCLDGCPFYEDSGYGYHLCSFTGNRRPDECPLIEIEIEKLESCWWCPCYDHNNYICGIRDLDEECKEEYKNIYDIPNGCLLF